MITIKYKGVEANCTTVDEAIELIRKLDLEKITIQPNVPNQPQPHDPITHPHVTWTADSETPYTDYILNRPVDNCVYNTEESKITQKAFEETLKQKEIECNKESK